MTTQNHRSSGRRSYRGPRRSSHNRRDNEQTPATSKPSLWQRVMAFFGRTPSSNTTAPSSNRDQRPEAQRHRPEAVEVTSPRLYIGNLSFDAAESDLFDLFNGVGSVQNAEIVTHHDTQRSKGFGFVTMASIEEAKRAVQELHDRPFLGRKLVVSGAKSINREPNYRG